MKIEASKLIREFSNQFLNETKNPYHSTSNTRIVTETLPAIIREGLNLENGYKIYGSVGAGNWSEIPWIAILDKSISKSTTQGYYVVILFDKDLHRIHLSLSVGWTQFEKEYGTKVGRLKMRAMCNHYSRLLVNKPKGFNTGLVDLKASNSLGKGYEEGSIISKKYLISELYDDVLFADMGQLVVSYLELKTIVGNSILNLDVDLSLYDDSLAQFKKKVALESFSKDTVESLEMLIKIANEAPPEIRVRLKKEIVRNRKFANHVKERVNYICEVCSRDPFIQVNGRPYAEADHINPLGGKFKGLDSPDNMRCLCAQCHAILTHGSENEIAELFSQY